jgi:hypothetical protein
MPSPTDSACTTLVWATRRKKLRMRGGPAMTAINAKRAEVAIQFMVDSAEQYAVACADVARLENAMKATKAALMNASPASSAAMKECDALADQRYIEYIGQLAEAVRTQTYLKTKLKAAELTVDVFRTLEASNRRVDRAAT